MLTIYVVTATNTDDGFEWHVQQDTLDDGLINYLPADDLSHDCKTIRPIDHLKAKNDPFLKQFKIKKIYVKYNFAYGIPIFGVANFTDESMLRACYLLRYLFAGNEWLRRYGRQTKLKLIGDKGGWCCPPQMGNNGLSCSCATGVKYPNTGMGAPAHEMAHWFIRRMLKPMARDGRLKIPAFQDDEYHTYSPTKYAPRNDTLSDFLLNSYHQDKARGSTKIRDEKLHHYFIYTGQQNFVINNGGLVKTRANQNKLKVENKNLYALLTEVWQCENNYITVCKDAAYSFTKGLAQIMNIAKADPNNPEKMICSRTLDTAEINTPSPITTPSTTLDVTQAPGKCEKVLMKNGWGSSNQLLPGVVQQSLGNDSDDMGNEAAWYLRRCCAKTAKFSFV